MGAVSGNGGMCVRATQRRYASLSARYPPIHVPDLVVQGQERHWGVNGLTTLGTEPYDFQPSLVDLLSQLIHSYVTWSTDEHRPSMQGEQTSQCSPRRDRKCQLAKPIV